MEYQRRKDRQDRGLTDASGGDISLLDVVISPTSSPRGSFSQLRGEDTGDDEDTS